MNDNRAAVNSGSAPVRCHGAATRRVFSSGRTRAPPPKAPPTVNRRVRIDALLPRRLGAERALGRARGPAVAARPPDFRVRWPRAAPLVVFAAALAVPRRLGALPPCQLT